MIVQVVFVALLLCASAEAAAIKIKECGNWACFVTAKCVEETDNVLYAVGKTNPIVAKCDGFLMIRPYSKNRWLVVIESWDNSATEVKVLQEAADIFSCKKDGSNSVAASSLPEFKALEKYSDRPISCKFIVGDGANEVLKVGNGAKISMSVAPSAVASDTTHRKLVDAINGKVTCDPRNIKFEPASSDVVAEEVSLDATCTNYKLQYKDGSNYVDVTGEITCEGTTADPNDYKYKFTTADGEKEEPGQFHARCAAKACSFCTAPSVDAGKMAPELKDESGCKTLMCPKFFKIGDEPVTETFVGACTNVENEGPKWTIGGKKVEKVECVDEMPCQTITSGCTGDCKLDSKGMPSCQKSGQTLSATIGGAQVQSVNITCDSSRGQLKYKGEGKASGDLPPDTAFSCTEVKAQEIVATGGVPTPLMACLMVALVLSLALIACSFALWFWKRNKDKKKAAENGEKKEKIGEENGEKKDKTGEDN